MAIVTLKNVLQLDHQVRNEIGCLDQSSASHSHMAEKSGAVLGIVQFGSSVSVNEKFIAEN
jgi:hypothetical protein